MQVFISYWKYKDDKIFLMNDSIFNFLSSDDESINAGGECDVCIESELSNALIYAPTNVIYYLSVLSH
jgi:hypothetical protein